MEPPVAVNALHAMLCDERRRTQPWLHGEKRPGEQESLKQKLRSEPVSLPLLPRRSESLVKLCPVQVDRVVCWSSRRFQLGCTS